MFFIFKPFYGLTTWTFTFQSLKIAKLTDKSDTIFFGIDQLTEQIEFAKCIVWESKTVGGVMCNDKIPYNIYNAFRIVAPQLRY